MNQHTAIKEMLRKGVKVEAISSLTGETEEYLIQLKSSLKTRKYRKIEELNQKVKDEIINNFKNGASIRKLAKSFNILELELSTFIDALFPGQRRTKKTLTESDKDIVVKMYQSKTPVTKIAATIGIHETTVVNILKKRKVYKVQKKYANRLSDESKKLIDKLYDSGANYSEIAKRLDVALSTVIRYLERTRKMDE